MWWRWLADVQVTRTFVSGWDRKLYISVYIYIVFWLFVAAIFQYRFRKPLKYCVKGMSLSRKFTSTWSTLLLDYFSKQSISLWSFGWKSCKIQWQTLDEWGWSLNNGPKLTVEQIMKNDIFSYSQRKVFTGINEIT